MINANIYNLLEWKEWDKNKNFITLFMDFLYIIIFCRD